MSLNRKRVWCALGLTLCLFFLIGGLYAVDTSDKHSEGKTPLFGVRVARAADLSYVEIEVSCSLDSATPRSSSEYSLSSTGFDYQQGTYTSLISCMLCTRQPLLTCGFTCSSTCAMTCSGSTCETCSQTCEATCASCDPPCPMSVQYGW